VLASAVISRDGLPTVVVSPNDRTVLLQFLQVRRHSPQSMSCRSRLRVLASEVGHDEQEADNLNWPRR
jgi:hypothetical protein